MYDNMELYWILKEENRNKALDHIQDMNKKYYKQIQESVNSSVIYYEDFLFDNSRIISDTFSTFIQVVAEDSVTSILTKSEGKTAVLNFASFKNPGGKYIEGSMAQEECLCSESILYNVLSNFQDSYYTPNSRGSKNRCLYFNRCIYSPNIIFERNSNIVACNVITCAAPNYRAGSKYCNVSVKDNIKALTERIKFVLNIAKYNNIETLILGAYGCGVSGQEPGIVSNIFKHYLETEFKNIFKNVYFSIPDVSSNNYKTFLKNFN